MKKILFIIVLFGMSNIFGQTINWLDITNLHDLPDGVKLYEGSRTSPALKIYYYDVDLNNNLLAVRPYISNNIKTVPNFAKAVGAYGAINGGYFATGSANSYSSVIYPNEVKAQNVKAVTRNSKSYPVLRSLFSQKTDGSLSVDWIYHFGATLNDLYKFDSPLDYIENDLIIKDTPSKSSGSLYPDILTGIGGGPTLIKNGEIKITYNEEIMWGSGVGLTNRDPRSAVGFTEDNHVIMIVANGRLAASEGVSLNELSEILLSLGCIEAMNLDGGGSSQLSSKDSYISIPSLREVPSILAIVHKDSLKIPSESNWEEIIDTEDSNANIVGGSWFESANQGYYGESPSILSPLGTGENYCSYEFNITKSGNYEVSGWWVAASNRCKNTPYIILSSSFSDTIYVNQTENGSSWFPLGEYDLIENSTLTIKITDSGSLGDYVVADAIKLELKNTATSIGALNQSIPESFVLFQNYPNPFNPTTTIKFIVPHVASGFSLRNVQLQVYDVLGRKIKTLVNRVQSPGSYEVNFDAANLSSGIYYYQLKSAGFINTKKMIILK